MTKLSITLDIDNDDTYPGKDPKQNGPEVTWDRLLFLLRTYTPSNKSLSIRDGLSDPITQDLMIGKLRIEVTDPYVAPEPELQFAPGTVITRDSGKSNIVRLANGDWLATYDGGVQRTLHDYDRWVRADLKGMGKSIEIIFTPPVSGKN